jgi:hypothetical protein
VLDLCFGNRVVVAAVFEHLFRNMNEHRLLVDEHAEGGAVPLDVGDGDIGPSYVSHHGRVAPRCDRGTRPILSAMKNQLHDPVTGLTHNVQRDAPDSPDVLITCRRRIRRARNATATTTCMECLAREWVNTAP